MRDFQFVTAGEIAGSWEPKGLLKWQTSQGQQFFLATWSSGQQQYGWFGIYHESLNQLPKLACKRIDRWTDCLEKRRLWSHLADLSKRTPGWGLVRADNERVHLFRDPVGRLPIYWARHRSGVEWGTRPAVLQRFDGELRRSRVERFLACSKDYKRDDFWQEILRVRAGECLIAGETRRPAFVDWWPDSIKKIPEQIPAEQLVADLLGNALERIADRGGTLVSLSGGVDSTLLLALLASQGRSPSAISMVAPQTSVFDERATIETILKATESEGYFFDISGELSWGEPEHCPSTVDLGPSPFPGAGYIRPLLKEAGRIVGEDRPKVLIAGVGADQLFNCNRDAFVNDSIEGGRGWYSAIGRRRWKNLVKGAVRTVGGESTLSRMAVDSFPPWLTYYRNSFPDIRLSSVYRRPRWLRKRRRQFKSWAWEYTARILEKYRRTTGVLYELPFLIPELMEIALSFPPRILRTWDHRKKVLRNLLRGRVPDAVASRRKYGLFDEVVWRGVSRHLRPSPEELLTDTHLERHGWASEEPLRAYAAKIPETLDTVGRKHGREFWRGLAVELWVRTVYRVYSGRGNESSIGEPPRNSQTMSAS